MLQIIEIQDAAPFLLHSESRVKIPHQGKQSGHGRIDRPQVGQDLRPGLAAGPQQLPQRLFRGRADGLDLLHFRQGLVHLLPSGGRKAGRPDGPHGLPALSGGQSHRFKQGRPLLHGGAVVAL